MWSPSHTLRYGLTSTGSTCRTADHKLVWVSRVNTCRLAGCTIYALLHHCGRYAVVVKLWCPSIIADRDSGCQPLWVNDTAMQFGANRCCPISITADESEVKLSEAPTGVQVPLHSVEIAMQGMAPVPDESA